MRLDVAVARGIQEAMERRACIDMRWRIFPEVQIHYPRFVRDVAWCAFLATTVGWMPPPFTRLPRMMRAR